MSKEVKIVFNDCFGGFSPSKAAEDRYKELTGKPFDRYKTPRTDPALVQVVEELGRKASSSVANLKIAIVTKGTRYRITEYDGLETVETPDDIEWETA